MMHRNVLKLCINHLKHIPFIYWYIIYRNLVIALCYLLHIQFSLFQIQLSADQISLFKLH